MKKLLWLPVVLLFASSAFAAGGTCPSGAQFTNPLNPTGPLVTLASLNITGCYFVAANGLDSNSGLDEGHPWLHAPQMPNCSSACATVQNASGGIPKSSGIILRGGDTWHMGIKTDSAGNPSTGGTWNFHSGQNPQPTPANPIYVGVDTTWFTGGSWVRPIINGDNPLCNGSLISATCILNVGAVDQIYYVTSCTYQNGSGTNTFFDFSFVGSAYIVDNFELVGMCQNQVGPVNHNDDYFNIASLHAGPIYLTNIYAHGSTHLQFGANNGQNCAALTCFNMTFIDGSSATQGPFVLKTVIDFTDSDPVGTGYCKSGGMYNLAYSVVLGTSQCIANDFHLIHDNIIGNFYENGHSNLFESNNDAETSGTNAMYNNLMYHLEDTPSPGTGGQLIDLSPPVGTTDNFFNNIMYAIGNVNPIFGFGNHHSGGGNVNNGQYNNWNNTFQLTHSQPVYSCSDDPAGQGTYPYSEANDFFISDNSAITGNSGAGVNGCAGTTHVAPQGNCGLSSCSVSSTVVTLLKTNAQATTAGYTNSQTYVFAPTSGASPTVGQGTAIAAFCTALTTAASSDSTLSDAAAACSKDTRYACTYNQTNHTVSCPARTAIARPISGSPDLGYIQFGGAATPTFNPVAGTYTASQSVTISSTSFTVICYNFTGSPATNGSTGCTTGTLYSSPVTVGVSETLYAVAGGTGFASDSSVGSAAYVLIPFVSPTSANFGSLAQGSQSVAKTFTFTNQTGASITNVGSTYASGVNFFTASSPSNTCVGTLSNLSSCSISVLFNPTTVGALSDTLQLNYTGATGSPVTVALSGTGTGVVVPGTPAAKALIAKNLGACPVCTASMQPCLCFTQDQNLYLSTGGAYSLFATFIPPVTSVNGHTGAVVLKPTITIP